MENITSTRRFPFPEFVAKFPPVSMPVTLGEETHHAFSTENEPLSDGLIRQYILPYESAEADEFTEFVPCFAIDDTDKFIALVWWRASLLEYEYVLATFTDKGEMIDRKTIAFTRVREGKIQRAVASIDEEWEIFIAEGTSAGADEAFDPGTSHTFRLEILPDGQIG